MILVWSVLVFELNCCYGAVYQCGACFNRLDPFENRSRLKRIARARGYGGVLRAMSPRKAITEKAVNHG